MTSLASLSNTVPNLYLYLEWSKNNKSLLIQILFVLGGAALMQLHKIQIIEFVFFFTYF